MIGNKIHLIMMNPATIAILKIYINHLVILNAIKGK
jgi:hypothetical protein